MSKQFRVKHIRAIFEELEKWWPILLESYAAAPPAPPVATTGAVPREDIQELIAAAEVLASIEEYKGCESACGYAKMYRASVKSVRRWLSASPAPPATTWAVPIPRGAIERLLSLASDVRWCAPPINPFDEAARDRDVKAVGYWLASLSAAPAPKKYRCRACGEVSEGEPDCCNYGTQNPEVVAPAPKASEGEERICGNAYVPPELRGRGLPANVAVRSCEKPDGHEGDCGALAQPHARAEGATGGIPVSEALDWPEHRSWCVHHKGERCDCGRNAAEETLRRALSGSAEGLP